MLVWSAAGSAAWCPDAHVSYVPSHAHSNALRQARAVGTYLVVGLIGDEDILTNKGSSPVMPFEERYAALKACKFVDRIIRCVRAVL